MTAILTLTVPAGCGSTVDTEYAPATEIEVSEVESPADGAECLEIVTDLLLAHTACR